MKTEKYIYVTEARTMNRFIDIHFLGGFERGKNGLKRAFLLSHSLGNTLKPEIASFLDVIAPKK